MNDPNRYYYYKILGLTSGASPGEVKRAYRKLVKAWHPDNFPHSPQQRQKAEAKIKKINEAYESLKHFQPAIARAPKRKVDPQPYYKQGVELARQNQYQQAIEELTKAILIDPDYIDAYLYRGFLYEKLGHSLRAEKDFNKATKLKLRTAATAPAQPPPPRQPQPSPTESQPWVQAGSFQKHLGVVSCVAISPDGKTLVTGSYDQTLTLWQLSTGRVLHTLTGHGGKVYCVAIAPDGRTIASGSGDRSVRLWKLSTGRELRTCGGWLGSHSDRVLAVAFSPNRRKLVSGSADRAIKIWRVSSGKELRSLCGQAAAVVAAAISPDGKVLASGGLEKILRIREMNGRLIRSIRGQSKILAIAFSPDGKILAAGGFNGAIALWDWQTGEQVGTLNGHGDRISSLAFSADGNTLASGSWDRSIKLWDWEGRTERYTLNGHSDRVCAVAFSPDSRTLVSGSADRTVKIWWAN